MAREGPLSRLGFLVLAQPFGDLAIKLAKHCINAKWAGFVFRSESNRSSEQANHFTLRNGTRTRPNCFWKRTTLQNFAEVPRHYSIHGRFGIPTQRRPEFAEHSGAIEPLECGADEFVARRMRK